MLVDALLLANDYLKLTSYIEGPSKFWKVYLDELSGLFYRLVCEAFFIYHNLDLISQRFLGVLSVGRHCIENH